jgi:hypothetical protein
MTKVFIKKVLKVKVVLNFGKACRLKKLMHFPEQKKVIW